MTLQALGPWIQETDLGGWDRLWDGNSIAYCTHGPIWWHGYVNDKTIGVFYSAQEAKEEIDVILRQEGWYLL